MDIAISGLDSFGDAQSHVLRNAGGFRFDDIHAGLNGIWNGELKWCDYDEDGRQDIPMNGDGISAQVYIYHNEGSDRFRLASPYMKGGAGTLD